MIRRTRLDAIRRSLALTEAETELVRGQGPRLACDVETWVERFYTRIVLDPVAMEILGDEGRVLRLRRSLQAWFHEIFSLPLDDTYAQVREGIGRTHVRIALPQHLMVTAMGALQRDVASSIDREFADDPATAARMRVAMGKTLDLELALMLAVYAEEIEALRARPSRESPPPTHAAARAHVCAEPSPEEAVRRLAEVGKATSTFAHEIRNPLASLAGAIDLLSQDLPLSERSEVAGLARERLDHMRRLLDDTLRLARPVRGDPEAMDVRTAILSALEGTRTNPLFREVDVRFEDGGDPPLALAHPEALRQALWNLLLNAAEAQGGKGRITVRARTDDAGVSIFVSDDGPGIPVDRRDQVFDPFWTTKPRGTGLGLSFVRRAAEAAGGSAGVEDADRGACVVIRLQPAP